MITDHETPKPRHRLLGTALSFVSKTVIPLLDRVSLSVHSALDSLNAVGLSTREAVL